MQKILLILLITATTLTACMSKTETYERKIRRTKLVQILADMHLADAVAEDQCRESRSKIFLQSKQYSNAILKHYEVTQADFDETWNYYTQHPLEMDELYEQVIEEITKRETQIK